MNESHTNENLKHALHKELSNRRTAEYQAMVQTFLMEDYYTGNIENKNGVPGKRVINNIMGYARAMEVLIPKNTGHVFILRN